MLYWALRWHEGRRVSYGSSILFRAAAAVGSWPARVDAWDEVRPPKDDRERWPIELPPAAPESGLEAADPLRSNNPGKA
jgi:hypothetical protein